MGALAKFLLVLGNLVRNGTIKKIPDAIKFAKQEFGEVTPLIKKQIEKVFESAKKPLVGKPGTKEGTVLPLVKKIAEKKNEGIASLEDSSPLMDKINKRVEDVKQDFVNPKRPGGSLDPATGITRALVRKILERKGIEIGKKDPINVFTDTFGESISDVNNLAEEMLEIDRRGGGMKDMDQMLEADGLFDIEIPTNPQKGSTDDELLELIKKTDEEKNLRGKEINEIKEGVASVMKDTSPAGLTKSIETDDLMLKYPGMDKNLAETIANAPPKMKAYIISMVEQTMELDKLGKSGDEIIDIFKQGTDRTKQATGGRVRAASGGLARILNL